MTPRREGTTGIKTIFPEGWLSVSGECIIQGALLNNCDSDVT